MKLGYIDYLNCYPFYYHMFEKEPLPGVSVFGAYPSGLNAMMAKGELDMSPISAAAYADMEKDVVLLPHFCLSSVGYVHSVILNSLLPIEDLHGRRVGLSSASKTSVVLLKILLKSYYSIDPVYVPASPSPRLKSSEMDAALIIGNEAMKQEMSPYTYDLGDLWLRKTGYPVVFAVFAVSEAAARNNLVQVRAVTESYYKSLACLDLERATLLEKAAARYPGISFDLDAYYRSLEYDFVDELKTAFEFYLSRASELGLLGKVGPLKFMDPASGGVASAGRQKAGVTP